MFIECRRDDLKNAVALAERMTAKNTTLPVLSAVLFTAQKNTITVRATNLEMGIEIEVAGKTKKEGSVVISGTLLNNILSTILDTDTITLEEKEGNVVITTPHNNILLKSLPSEDFPTIPVIENKQTYTIPGEQLLSGIRSVLFSASTSEVKPELSSVYIYPHNGHLIFVATDTVRLTEKKIAVKNQYDFDSIILPVKAARELVRILEGFSGEATILLSDNQMACFIDGVYFTSRLINGAFPDYNQIIPKEHTTEAIILKQDLQNTLKISSIFADKFYKATLYVDPNKKTCVLSSHNTDVGENTTHVDAVLKGDAVTVHINQRFLAECLGYIEKDSVVVQFNGAHKALVLKGAGDNSFMYLLMPMSQ